MKRPPAVQMTAGGMLIFLVVSKKHRHVKRQMPDAVFLQHIFKSGFGVVDQLLQGPFFMSSSKKRRRAFALLYSQEDKNRSTVFRLEFCRKRSFEAKIGERRQRQSKE